MLKFYNILVLTNAPESKTHWSSFTIAIHALNSKHGRSSSLAI